MIVASLGDPNGAQTLYASDEIYCDDSGDCKDHLFTVDQTYHEETTDANGETKECRLTAGDLIQRDDSQPLDTEPSMVDDGTGTGNEVPEVDDDGNQVYITYVPMVVTASKYHSCAAGQTVTMQLSSLQGMLTEEVARVQEGQQQAVVIGFHP